MNLVYNGRARQLIVRTNSHALSCRNVSHSGHSTKLRSSSSAFANWSRWFLAVHRLHYTCGIHHHSVAHLNAQCSLPYLHYSMMLMLSEYAYVQYVTDKRRALSDRISCVRLTTLTVFSACTVQHFSACSVVSLYDNKMLPSWLLDQFFVVTKKRLLYQVEKLNCFYPRKPRMKALFSHWSNEKSGSTHVLQSAIVDETPRIFFGLQRDVIAWNEWNGWRMG